MSIPTEHPYEFDPTYGLAVEELRAIKPPQGPPDFDEFWRARYLRALGVNPQPQLSESRSSHPDWRVQDIVYTSTGEFQIGGWLLLPREGEVRRGLVVGHGYGGRDEPDFDIPVEETAVLFPCCRGLSRSRRPGIASDPYGHVLHDIDRPERYILGGCVEDSWLAVSVLARALSRAHWADRLQRPELRRRRRRAGDSLSTRIDRGHLVVPTFGNMPLWLTLPTVGSGRSVQTYRKTHADVLKTLSYFDASTAATRIEIPMLIAVARFDPVVAPPCQFSIANALPTSNHHETVILDAGSFRLSWRRRAARAPLGNGETVLRGDMRREYRRWRSPALHRDMELLIFGHAGAKVLMFPTRDGRFWEYEKLSVVASLADKVKAGHLQLYCIEGLARETFYDAGRHPADRIRRHAAFEDYILHEVLPLMAWTNPHDCTMAMGCSLGAFQAASLVLRHPHLFRKLVAFSGRYDLTMKVECFDDLFDGYYDDDIYFHTPTHFLPGLTCPWRLENLRRLDIVLAVGKDDPFLDNNRRLSRLLEEKSVRHQLHFWDGRAHRAARLARDGGAVCLRRYRLGVEVGSRNSSAANCVRRPAGPARRPFRAGFALPGRRDAAPPNSPDPAESRSGAARSRPEDAHAAFLEFELNPLAVVDLAPVAR